MTYLTLRACLPYWSHGHHLPGALGLLPEPRGAYQIRLLLHSEEFPARLGAIGDPMFRNSTFSTFGAPCKVREKL